jgi:hypothetical protein
VHVTGKPTDLFTKFKPEPGFHFLTVPLSKELLDYYVPTKLTSTDYPNLIPAGQSVETIGVPQVLAVYNWPPNTDRYRRVARFVEYFFDRFDQFQKPPFHAKWKEISLSSSLPGWTRFRAAEELLAKQPQRSGQRIELEAPHAVEAPHPVEDQNTVEEQNPSEIFNRFRGWSETNPAPAGR